ncbi:MAG: hypothetical protein MPK30_03340 [Gammaproteobacteria bacterium]|nr:hypothetical protein [Gammaproteobacteria bacterium]
MLVASERTVIGVNPESTLRTFRKSKLTVPPPSVKVGVTEDTPSGTVSVYAQVSGENAGESGTGAPPTEKDSEANFGAPLQLCAHAGPPISSATNAAAAAARPRMRRARLAPFFSLLGGGGKSGFFAGFIGISPSVGAGANGADSRPRGRGKMEI